MKKNILSLFLFFCIDPRFPCPEPAPQKDPYLEYLMEDDPNLKIRSENARWRQYFIESGRDPDSIENSWSYGKEK